MNYNYLKLDQDKSVAIFIASLATLSKISHLSFSIPGFITSSVAEVRNVGLTLDSTLCYDTHIKNITKTALFHLKTTEVPLIQLVAMLKTKTRLEGTLFNRKFPNSDRAGGTGIAIGHHGGTSVDNKPFISPGINGGSSRNMGK